MEYTKKTRHLIYKKALAIYESNSPVREHLEHLTQNLGMCTIFYWGLNLTTDELSTFSEFYLFEPAEHKSFWFSDNIPDDLKYIYRKQILMFCIEMTK